MAQFIVNNSGTVHSVPDEWVAEKLASGYRLAEQNEIDATYKAEGIKNPPQRGDLDRSYRDYLASIEAASLVQSTTIGPAPGTVDVRLTRPGDPGFVIGSDGMRQVPSTITTATLNEGTRNDRQFENSGHQDAHVYEVVVPEVAHVSGIVRPNAEQESVQKSIDDHQGVSDTASFVEGPTPAINDAKPDLANNQGPSAAEIAEADAAAKGKSAK